MRLSILFLRTFFVTLFHLTPIWGVLAIFISIGGVWIGILEDLGWVDGLYFGWITGTTIGYGDISPTLPLTKFLCVVIGIVGTVSTGIIVAAAVASLKVLISHEGLGTEIKKKMEKQLEDE